MRRSLPARKRPTSSFIWRCSRSPNADRTIRNRCSTIARRSSATRAGARSDEPEKQSHFLAPGSHGRSARRFQPSANPGVRVNDPYCVVQAWTIGRVDDRILHHRTSRRRMEWRIQILRDLRGCASMWCNLPTPRHQLVDICAHRMYGRNPSGTVPIARRRRRNRAARNRARRARRNPAVVKSDNAHRPDIDRGGLLRRSLAAAELVL